MSANLIDGLAPTLLSGTTESEGTFHHAAFEGKEDIIAWQLSGQKALAANQTVHLGLSLRGASANASDLHMVVAYVDGAGNRNWAWGEAMPVGTSWGRAEATVVIPSGMTMYMLTVSTRATAKVPEVWMAAPTLSLGSPVPLAISSTTLAWSAGIVATTRYYKLASATSSTPAVPTSSSALNGWSETEPTADVTKVMWVCERTVYADGTESWSKASKSTSYEAAKDAKSAANAAKNTADSAKSAADNLKTLIHEGDDGITVGKSADGKTWSTGRTRMTANAYQILDKAGAVITQLAADGASFLSGLVRIVAGKATLPGNETVNSIVIDAGDGVAALHGIISRLDATINGIKSSVIAGWEQDFGSGVVLVSRNTSTHESSAFAVYPYGVRVDGLTVSQAACKSDATSDLNYVDYGVCVFKPSTGNNPAGNGYGYCITVSNGNGGTSAYWRHQVALVNTDGIYTRECINPALGSGWTPWRRMTFYNKPITPVYRLYNQYNSQHLFVSSESEYNSLVSQGWTGEGIVFYAFK